jgi:hypothetical protein
MPIRRLINLFDGFAVGSDPASVRPDNATPPRFLNGAQLNLLDVGTVQSVGFHVFVTIKGATSQVNMATDEPLRAGQKVWVSRTVGGDYVCHGSVK